MSLIAGIWLLQHRRFWHFSQTAEGGQANVHRFWRIFGEEVSNNNHYFPGSVVFASYIALVMWQMHFSCDGVDTVSHVVFMEGRNDGCLHLDTLGCVHQTEILSVRGKRSPNHVYMYLILYSWSVLLLCLVCVQMMIDGLCTVSSACGTYSLQWSDYHYTHVAHLYTEKCSKLSLKWEAIF